jgi:acyl-CoA synthetase (AMP-forming)/AMP-acid ligase II
VVAGAAPAPGLRVRAERLGVALVEYYGAAELSFVAVDVDGSGLRPFPGVEVRLRDGVLWVRSPYLAESVDGVPVADRDGWATTGDRARWGAAGTLELLGRPGTATVAGHTVQLAEVEAVLAAVPGVAEAVCLATPDPRLGQRLVAVVRRIPGSDPLPALRRAEEALPPSARPVRHHVVDDVPRTPSGKVDRVAVEGRWTRARP